MMLPLPRLVWTLALSSALLAPAAIEEWKDPQGNVFKAEPAEVLGPFALFRTPTGAGRRLPWRALSAADCVRFEAQAGSKPEPADRWIDANGELTGRLRGYLNQYESLTLINADLTAVPEPHLLIVFYVDTNASGSRDMILQAIAPYKALQAKRPGQVAAIQFGAHHGAQEHNDMALRTEAPWLLVTHSEQRRIPTLFKLSPGRGDFALFVLSRDGVPIVAANNPDAAAVAQFFADIDVLLGLMQPGNPRSWEDRAHYLGALHAARHQQDSAAPLLVGNPLVAKGLKDRGIFRVAADIAVGVDGKATAVTLKNEADIPEAMRQPLAAALQRSAVFAPAVDHGQFVAGTYDYLIEVPR